MSVQEDLALWSLVDLKALRREIDVAIHKAEQDRSDRINSLIEKNVPPPQANNPRRP